MSQEQEPNESWPHHRPHTPQTQVVSLLIHDWRWQRFNETAVANPNDYPIYGWLRKCLAETESGMTYEVREWNFHVDCPATQVQAKAVA